MPGVIDADTHIIEPPGIWELMDPAMRHRRPVVVTVPTDTLYGTTNAMWLIDGKIFPRPGGKGGFRIATPSAQERQKARRDVALGCRELTDPEARVRDMDKDGVATQVVYPTLFLAYITDDAELDVALCRAYNQYLADACAKSHGRIRWNVILPLTSIDASVKELRTAKERGAVGVMIRGVEGDRSLADPYFFPIYEEASHLNMPICIHVGNGSPVISSAFAFEISGAFPHSTLLPVMAFRDLVANKIPEQFPKLRFGIIEAGSFWVPYILYSLKRQLGGDGDRWGPRLFHDYRLFIACEAEEDIPYLLKYIGEDHLIMGSDYAHTDPARQTEMVAKMRSREDLPARVTDKILTENARGFYPL